MACPGVAEQPGDVAMKSCAHFVDVSDESNLSRSGVHSRGKAARVLLTTVYGPYAVDDEHGSRLSNPMECYHNQVTRVQGAFSLRMFHRSYGIMMIQANIAAPCTVLDYPDSERFRRELEDCNYDIIGISAKLPNVKKVAAMCRLIREHQPGSTIVVGGHIANLRTLPERIDADYVVCGEGVRWFRRFLGEDVGQPLRHPCVTSAVEPRCMGVRLDGWGRKPAAALIPSVGCPMGCNFCSTSAMFGGKGRFVHFYETGDELFDVMCQLEEKMGTGSFMIMDENFLFHRRRALRLLQLMEENRKSWALYVFSSADVVSSYSMEQLVGLGISWVWIGVEGRHSSYGKLRNVDTRQLIGELQANGIRVLGSTIIGLEEHTPLKIEAEIRWAISHDADFHQFMLYMALPGTPLHEQLAGKGLLLDESECEEADIHGQSRFNHRHPHIGPGEETELLLRAFRQFYAAHGPSVIRMMRTSLDGWLKHKSHPDSRIRKRFEREMAAAPLLYAAAAWATLRKFKEDLPIATIASELLRDLHREFGLKSRLAAPLIGRYLLLRLHREEKRLARNRPCEPPTFYERAPTAVLPRPTPSVLAG